MNSLKHQLLEVVATNFIFNISNPSEPPSLKELYLQTDREMLVWFLITSWLLFYMVIFISCIRKVKAFKRFTDLLPHKGWIMLFGFLSKILMSYLEVDWILPAKVIQHLFSTTIILHASYRLYHPNRNKHLWSILAYAASNTLLTLAFVNILLSKVYASMLDPELTIFDCLEFSTIICVVGKYRLPILIQI